MGIDKRILNFIVIIVFTYVTFYWTFNIFHIVFNHELVITVILIRILASLLLFKDYSLSWSKASQKTFLIKSIVYLAAFIVYLSIFYGDVTFSLLASELFLYLFGINFAMYSYYYYFNKSSIQKTKNVIIYGAGKAGIKLEKELENSEYKVKFFVDDDEILQKRSIDSIRILSYNDLADKIRNKNKFDLLVIAMPSAPKERIRTIYENLSKYFYEIRVLPSLDDIFKDKDYYSQLKDITVEDLLARHPKDLDKDKIIDFIREKVVLVTGAGGSIGSEISRQCLKYGVEKLILLDHSEFNLYTIDQELNSNIVLPIMQTVTDLKGLEKTFEEYRPDIVIHAAAYKHVPLVEFNIDETIKNNIFGTKNCIDLSIKYNVKKFVLISTDKAVRPTNVMGTTKRICELYAQNSNVNKKTEIVAVRFGNVLGSSGSVIPKFKTQLEKGGPLTVTHPDITRYFMLISEACELVLQAGAIGKGGEIFILDMGEPVKIVDLAQKMIDLSGEKNIEIVFTGLRPGEKLYEELLIDDTDCVTDYKSITVAKQTSYSIDKLNQDINNLIKSNDKIQYLKKIVPEFQHNLNNK